MVKDRKRNEQGPLNDADSLVDYLWLRRCFEEELTKEACQLRILLQKKKQRGMHHCPIHKPSDN